MEFEYDSLKSEANKKKHGINFIQAQVLWKDQKRVVIPAKTIDEKRYILIAKKRMRVWTAIYTMRSHKIRIISVRRARREEVQLYES